MDQLRKRSRHSGLSGNIAATYDQARTRGAIHRGCRKERERERERERKRDREREFWPVGRFWITFGPLLGHFWVTFGSLLDRFWIPGLRSPVGQRGERERGRREGERRIER